MRSLLLVCLFCFSATILNAQSNTTPTVSVQFAAQLNAIVADFSSGFSSTKGAVTKEDEDGMGLTYNCSKALEGSTKVYLVEDLYDEVTKFYAEFPVSTDYEVATNNYNKLIQQIEATKLSCCVLEKKKEYVDGYNRAQSFKVAESGYGHTNMVIKILLDQGESNDDKGVLSADWKPVLEIYEN
jgi:hypothetical protein